MVGTVAEAVGTRRDAEQTRAERLERAVEALRERFGQWIVYRLRDARPAVGERTIPTGSLGLDRATGIGGVPRARVTELSGPPTSGKGTLATHIIANAQTNGEFAAPIDCDHSADLDRLRACGVDMGNLLLAVPRSAREALDMPSLAALQTVRTWLASWITLRRYRRGWPDKSRRPSYKSCLSGYSKHEGSMSTPVSNPNQQTTGNEDCRIIDDSRTQSYTFIMRFGDLGVPLGRAKRRS